MPHGEPEVAARLRDRGLAEVDSSARRRAEYSSDASLYRVVPAAVAFPRSAEEIAIAVEVCRELQVPLTMRGGGTSLAGNAIGPGVVVDVSRHLNRILSVDPDTRTASVEPGVILDDLQRAAAPHGLRLGPDPSTHSRCTIGGMIGNNACGSRALRYGRTADNVTALDVVTGTGEFLRAGGTAPDGSPVLAALQKTAGEHLAVIRTEFGRFGRQISGYSLEHLLPERGFDVPKMLVGTEGTCAVTTRATVALRPAPARTILVVLGYPSLADAADAVPQLLPLQPVAIEGLDAGITDLGRAALGSAAAPDLPSGRGLVMVELPGDSQAELDAAARELIALAGAPGHVIAADPRQAAAIWRIREDGAGLVARPPGGRPHHAGWEDAAVPPEGPRQLPARVRRPAGRAPSRGPALRPLRRWLRAHQD